MITPHVEQLVMAQGGVAGELVAASNGLTQGGLAFVCVVLAVVVWALYREVRDWQGKYIALMESCGKEKREQVEARAAMQEKHGAEVLAIYKENMPIAMKMADGVRSLERITDKLVKD